MSRIVVTGANGFVGRALCRLLLEGGHSVTGLVRQPGGCIVGVQEWVDSSQDFAGIETLTRSGTPLDCVVHLAARVHVMHEDSAEPDAAFRMTNVEGALRVARTAREWGVSRFVFVSSIKAVGEYDLGRPLREDDPAMPQDAYGRSKLAAEQALTRYGEETGLDVVIVRPPLVYGPQVRANFLRLMDAIWKGLPLPLAAVDARRSLVYVDNLADALVRCAIDQRAARQCFHVADDTALTVAELSRSLAHSLDKPSRLLPVPPGWLKLAGKLVGREAYVDRLTGSLQLDTTRIQTVLGWQPPYSTEDGLAATAQWYRDMH